MVGDKTIFSISIFTCVIVFHIFHHRRRRRKKQRIFDDSGRSNFTAYESLVGNTPLIRLNKISCMLGNTSIYVKMECNNPARTGKDRAALHMINVAEESGQLPFGGGGYVIEGTSGSTGISLAHLCLQHGHQCILFMPDDQAQEKEFILKTLGAKVYTCQNCSISNPNHYVNQAKHLWKKLLKEEKQAFFVNQFDNLQNFNAHYQITGPEILNELEKVDVFVMSSGTGGTIAGVGSYLKEKTNCQIVLVDPHGSVLHSKVQHGVAFNLLQSEQTLKRHQYNTIVEGIGLDRITANFDLAVIDESIQVTDQEALDMAHFILREEGLFIGSSSAMNLVGAIRIAQQTKYPSNIVTIICDEGYRHLTRFWNREFIEKSGLVWPDKPDCFKTKKI